MTANTRATVPILHRFLGIGLVALAAVFLALYGLGMAPLLKGNGSAPIIGYALATIDVVAAAVALLVFKPRVPRRQPGQSVD